MTKHAKALAVFAAIAMVVASGFGRTNVVSGFSRTSVVSGFSRTSVVSGFSQTNAAQAQTSIKLYVLDGGVL